MRVVTGDLILLEQRPSWSCVVVIVVCCISALHIYTYLPIYLVVLSVVLTSVCECLRAYMCVGGKIVLKYKVKKSKCVPK